MKIFYPGNNETLKYAAEELEKYIHMMDKAANVCITEQPDGDISLGCFPTSIYLKTVLKMRGAMI